MNLPWFKKGEARGRARQQCAGHGAKNRLSKINRSFSTNTPLKKFTLYNDKTLKAAVERALPGAVDAGVIDHMAYWMTHDPYFSGLQDEFKFGLKQLDRIAYQLHKKIFC